MADISPRSNKNHRHSRDSWEHSSEWYQKLLGERGSFYHEELILPKLSSLLELNEKDGKILLDLGCGQGVLLEILPPFIDYWGIDLSPKLLSFAKERKASCKTHFLAADCEKSLSLPPSLLFDRGIFLLSLQNMADGKSAIASASTKLRSGGFLLLIVNHPCFRIPRQSHWHVDEKKTSRSRLIQRYLTPLSIPMETYHPRSKPTGCDRDRKTNPPLTFSYHTPLSQLVAWLSQANCLVDCMEEWVSPKRSEGGARSIENLSRREIPLFMAIRAVKR